MHGNFTEEKKIGDYLITTDQHKIDIQTVHEYLSKESYWAKGMPLNLLQTAIENSLSFSILYHDKQVGFARMVTDFSTFGYLADVFILQEHRGKGISKQLMEFILSMDMIKHFRRILLATKDAHGLYTQFGFEPLDDPTKFMQIFHKGIYENLK
jgi:GNAT superfamily N-acetyltransferase